MQCMDHLVHRSLYFISFFATGTYTMRLVTNWHWSAPVDLCRLSHVVLPLRTFCVLPYIMLLFPFFSSQDLFAHKWHYDHHSATIFIHQLTYTCVGITGACHGVLSCIHYPTTQYITASSVWGINIITSHWIRDPTTAYWRLLFKQGLCHHHQQWVGGIFRMLTISCCQIFDPQGPKRSIQPEYPCIRCIELSQKHAWLLLSHIHFQLIMQNRFNR